MYPPKLHNNNQQLCIPKGPSVQYCHLHLIISIFLVNRLISYCQQYSEFDNLLSTTELGSNPWITDDPTLWEAASTM